MKKVLFTIKNTYRAVKLLSDPHIMEIVNKELYKESRAPKVGKGSILPHKHYMVQILN